MVRLLQCAGLRGVGAVVCLSLLASEACAGEKAIRHLTLDKSADVVELFDGIDAGQFQVKMSALNANEANVFIKNTTDAPLTVAVPKAAVGVPILPQLFGQQGNVFGNNQNQNQGLDPNSGLAAGLGQLGVQSQSVGGQFQPFGNNQQGFPNGSGLGNGNGNLPNIGNGFFSIPPEKTVQIKMRTVCLNYGLPDPNPGITYELRRLESEITDPVLCELLQRYTPRIDQDAMQAAAWHLANNLTWKQIEHLSDNEVSALAGGRMFTPRNVKAAQSLVKIAEEAAKDRPKAEPEQPAESPRKVAASAKKIR